MPKTSRKERSTEELTGELRDAIEGLILREPDMRVMHLAATALEQGDPESLAELGRRLVFRLALQIARMQRFKASPRPQLALPGFEHMPRSIAVSDQKRVRLEDANYRDLRAYIRRLSNTYRQRARQDQKLTEARSLLETMARYNRTEPGITVAEVCAREAK